jgi:hypothetical protein
MLIKGLKLTGAQELVMTDQSITAFAVAAQKDIEIILIDKNIEASSENGDPKIHGNLTGRSITALMRGNPAEHYLVWDRGKSLGYGGFKADQLRSEGLPFNIRKGSYQVVKFSPVQRVAVQKNRHQLEKLFVAISMMDLGATIENGMVQYSESIKKARKDLPLLASQGVGGVYLYGGIHEPSATSKVLHRMESYQTHEIGRDYDPNADYALLVRDGRL